MSEDLNENINDIKNSVNDLYKNQVNLFKLEVIEKLTVFTTILLSIIVSVSLLTIIFIFTGLAFSDYINNISSSTSLGYIIWAIIFIVLFVLLIFFRKQIIINPITKLFSKVFFNQ